MISQVDSYWLFLNILVLGNLTRYLEEFAAKFIFKDIYLLRQQVEILYKDYNDLSYLRVGPCACLQFQGDFSSMNSEGSEESSYYDS